MTTAGYVYVVNTDGYLDEALVSLASLKAVHPDALVTVVTYPNLYRDDIQGVNWVELDGTYDSPIIKKEAMRAPYDRCIFLDSDTRVIGKLDEMFEILEAFDIAAVHEPTRGWDYETPASRAFPELNTGVIVFRNDDSVRTFFAEWSDLYDSIRAAQNLKNDQPAFRAALWNNRSIRHATLTTEFHLITGKGASIAWDARLLHGRDDLDHVEKVINSFYGPRVFAPGWGVLPNISGRKKRAGIYFRITKSFIRGLRRAGVSPSRETPVKWW